MQTLLCRKYTIQPEYEGRRMSILPEYEQLDCVTYMLVRSKEPHVLICQVYVTNLFVGNVCSAHRTAAGMEKAVCYNMQN